MRKKRNFGTNFIEDTVGMHYHKKEKEGWMKKDEVCKRLTRRRSLGGFICKDIQREEVTCWYLIHK